AGARAGAGAARGGLPHHAWQMDAVEQQPLQSGQNISWLRLADEASGAVLMTVVFPPGALQPGAHRPGAAEAARLLRPLGDAPEDEGGQRQPVGVVERPAAAFGVVADRLGGRDALERAAPAA